MLTLEMKLRILETEQALRNALNTSTDSEQYYNDYVSSLNNDELRQVIKECRQELSGKTSDKISKS